MTDKPNLFRTAGLDTSTPPAKVLNEIQITNLVCDEARTIDRKMDGSKLTTGNIVVSVATFEPNGINNPVPAREIKNRVSY